MMLSGRIWLTNVMDVGHSTVKLQWKKKKKNFWLKFFLGAYWPKIWGSRSLEFFKTAKYWNFGTIFNFCHFEFGKSEFLLGFTKNVLTRLLLGLERCVIPHFKADISGFNLCINSICLKTHGKVTNGARRGKGQFFLLFLKIKNLKKFSTNFF